MTNEDHLMPEGSAESVLRLTDQLEEMLGQYLFTVSKDEAEEALAEFETPRSAHVDDLLRRVELDRQPAALPELEQSLRDHLVAVHDGVYSAPSGSAERRKWRKRTASDIHRMVAVSDRVRSYVELVAFEDESVHTFDGELESTIKGVAPPNAPLLGVGAGGARNLPNGAGGAKHRRGGRL